MRSNSKPNLARSSQPVEAEFDEGNATGMETVPAPMMAMRSSYSTAMRVQRPRNLLKVEEAVLAEAELAGEDFFYAWTQKGELVEGPSIDGAMILARNWGNCAAEATVAADAPRHWILSAMFVDLETGFSLVRPFRQRKSESHSNADEDRNTDSAFQIGVSKASRNAILKALPNWLVAHAMEKAKDAAAGKYKDIPKFVEACKKAYAAIGVTVAELESKVGRSTAAWTSGDLATLRAILRSIEARVTSVEKEFRTIPDGEVPASPQQSPQSPPNQPPPTAPNSPPAPAPQPPAAASASPTGEAER